MKKIRNIIIYSIAAFIFMFVSGVTICTLPSMLVRTTWEVGKVNSYITVKDKERKMHIAYVDGKIVAMDFEKYLGPIWQVSGFVISSLEEEEILIRHCSIDNTTILYGIYENDNADSIIVEMKDGKMFETDINADGLYGIIIDEKWSNIKSITGRN